MEQSTENTLINKMNADEKSVELLADYLGYEVGQDPINPQSDIKILFTNKLETKETGVIALVPDTELNLKSKTVDIRKLYEQVIDIKDKEFGSDFSVAAIGFVGIKRLVFFPTIGGNRDTRLDLSPETIDIALYKNNLQYLNNNSIDIQESPFGFGAKINISDQAFRRQLSNHFLSVVSLYRKKLSEWITSSNLRNELSSLVTEKALDYIESNDINNLVQDDSYKAVLSTVVDTIILRQLMRRFLEGYYGSDSFNVDDIALGVGDGTLDAAIAKAVNIAQSIGDERQIHKLNKVKTPLGQLDLFETADSDFTEDERKATSKVEVKEGKKDYLAQLSEKATKQFKLTYGGDLFAGSIGEVATIIENRLAKERQEDWVKFYADTKAGNYSFRYEDMPPEAIEKQYEDSMSKNVQFTIDDKTKKPLVFYGNDDVEQKNKGAYYTDQKFVNYMVNQTVSREFNSRYLNLKKAVDSGNDKAIEEKLDYLLSLKIADFTSGGGSFLRGAFLKLAVQFKLINNLNIPEYIREKYNFLSNKEDSQYQWEDYILNNMIYGVDIDYKAVIISSLTLTLSSLQHRPKHTKLPQLIGRTLIHQNSLMNSVPFYKRSEVFLKFKKEIAKLINLKKTDFEKFTKLRDKLQAKVMAEVGQLSDFSSLLHVESLELNLPEIFFNEDGSVNDKGGMDIVIGNPPWEVWKPNSDEFFSEYRNEFRSLKKNEKKKIQSELCTSYSEIGARWKEEEAKYKAGSDYIRNTSNLKYQSWVVDDKKTSSDPNLYKVALERFTQLAKPNATFSILVPDNFATDNGSTGLRHLVLDKYNLSEFLSFENRKGIFPAVDGRYKFAVLSFSGSSKKTKAFKAFFYKQNLSSLNRSEEKLDYPVDFIKNVEPERYAFFEARDKDIFNLYKDIRLKFKPLKETKLILLGNDFHKTNDADKFIDKELASPTDIPMFEGKYINQFSIQPDKITSYISKKDVDAKLGNVYKNYRIALRSVASATNQHSLIATLLPPNVTAPHNLWLQKNVLTMKEQLLYLGYLNSYVLDFALRQLISMNISQTYLKQLPIPTIDDISDADKIIQIVKELLIENKGFYEDLDELVPGDRYKNLSHKELIAELNARVMHDFDLSRENVVTLMSTFISANHKEFVEEETQRILDIYDRM